MRRKRSGSPRLCCFVLKMLWRTDPWRWENRPSVLVGDYHLSRSGDPRHQCKEVRQPRAEEVWKNHRLNQQREIKSRPYDCIKNDTVIACATRRSTMGVPGRQVFGLSRRETRYRTRRSSPTNHYGEIEAAFAVASSHSIGNHAGLRCASGPFSVSSSFAGRAAPLGSS